MRKEILDYLTGLRPPRNSLGKICPPKSIIEYIVEDAYEEVVEYIEPTRPDEEVLTSLNLSELADRIVLKLLEHEILDNA